MALPSFSSSSTLTYSATAALALLVAFLLFPSSAPDFTPPGSTRSPSFASKSKMVSPPPITASSRLPSYFISHGGPPTLFDTSSAPYASWQRFGKEVLTMKPKGLVVVSAHWESERSDGAGVLVNAASSAPLIYDFYNFPPHFYQQTFSATSSPWLLDAVRASLAAGGVAAREVGGEGRGLDHGAWVPFKVAFPDPTAFPIVQISLPGDGSAESALSLGHALGSLRDQGMVVVGSGQPTHNLRALFSGSRGSDKPYDEFFSAVLAEVRSSDRLSTSPSLLAHAHYKLNHPTPEHLLPLHVAFGAGGEDARGEVLFEERGGPMCWGVFRFD